MAETKISDIIQKSLEEIKSIVDANTIIGEMIQTQNGTTILPVSKVSVGLASGGLDYLGKNAKETKAGQMNFGGGGGTGLTVMPGGLSYHQTEWRCGNAQRQQSCKRTERFGIQYQFPCLTRPPIFSQKLKQFFPKNLMPRKRIRQRKKKKLQLKRIPMNFLLHKSYCQRFHTNTALI